MAKIPGNLIFFAVGVVAFVIGAYLVQELIFKFLKFAVGLLLIFLSIPLILGGLGWSRIRRGKVVRMYRR